MQNNKLVLLFKSLSESELRELKLFVRSPFHNQRTDVILLFDALRKANLEKLKEEKLYAQVFPKSKFDKKALAYVMNYLMKVIEEYFAISALKKRKAQKEFWIAEAALEHGRENIFQQKIKKAKAILEANEIDNLEVQALHYQMDMAVYNHLKNQKRGEVLNLKKLTERLDIFLIGSKLRQACFLLAHENLSEIKYEQGFLNPILEYVESPAQAHLLKLPMIALYYFSYKTLKEEKAVYFQKFKQLLETYRTSFSKSELGDFYSIGLNFCIKQINQGKKKEYVPEAFEWYQKALKEAVLFEHGVLSQFHYKNIAALGLGLKEYDWVEGFLIKYKIYLDAKNRELNFNYNFAKLHYEKREYHAAMKLLQAVKYDDSLQNLTSKILLLKIYYELGEFEVLNSYLKSFDSSIRRQRKLGYHKHNYLNLTSIMRKFLNLNAFDKLAIQNLETFILSKEGLPEKKWLLERLENLIT